MERLRALKDSDPDATARVRLNLFDDASYELVSRRFKRTSAGYSLSGDLAGVPLGSATLVVNDGVVVGSVHTSRETYTVRSAGKGSLVTIRRVGPGFERLDEPTGRFNVGQTPARLDSRMASPAGRTDDEETVVDVLVVWSPEAEDEAGGREHMVATVDYLAAYANKAFADSGARVRINVPHMQKVDTEDDGGLNVWHALHGRQTALDHRDVRRVVMELRDRAGADLVHFVASGYPCAGIANIPVSVGGDEWSFLSMAKYACAGTAFVHEIGHNFGLRHDRFLDAAKTRKATPYGHGYVNQAAFEPDAPAAAAWRTIMAYDDQCSDLPVRCAWLPRFSDPNATHLGDPLGVPGEIETHALDGPADARRAIDEMRSAVAAYRNPRPNLSVSATVANRALEAAGPFALEADVVNLGRAAAAATTLVAYRSADAEVSGDDEVLARVTVDALGASGERTYSLNLTAPDGPGAYYYIACVGDDDAIDPCDAVGVTVGPTVSVSAAVATEGDPVRFKVAMSTTFPEEVRVSYTVARGTAVDGVDFEASAGTVSIAAGETEAWIDVATVDDATAEPVDALRMILSAVSPLAPEGPVVSIDSGTAEGMIVDNDGEFDIPDQRLRTAVLRALERGAGEEVTAADMATLTELSAPYVRDLTGLEFATGLISLELLGSSSSLAALSHLARLRLLDMPHWSGDSLEPLRGLRTLRVLDMPFSGREDLSPLSGLAGLRRLDMRGDLWIDGCTRRGVVADLSPLSGLVELRELELQCNAVADLRPLAGLRKLRQLRLPGNEVSSLRGVENKPGLWALELDGNPVSNLSPVRGLTALSWLTLNGAPVADLSPLRDLAALRVLRIANSGTITDVAALEGMPACADLDLQGNEIADLSPLRGLGALRSLNLDDNRVADLQPLAGLSLDTLKLDGNLIEDVAPLAGMPLTQLSLRGNLIGDIAPLAGIASLTHLWLDGNAVDELEPLGGLTGLRHLGLGGNLIADIEPLSDLAYLVSLDLTDNYVADIAPLAGLVRLHTLHLGNNRVADLSVVTADAHIPALRTFYVYGNPLAGDDVHVARLRDRGVSVYRTVALAMDASAKEGDDIEAVVRLTEVVAEPVKLRWGVLGADVPRSRTVVDAEVTASDDDIDLSGACLGYLQACRETTVPAGSTRAETFLRVHADDRRESHETFVIEVVGGVGKLPAGVSLPWPRPGWLGERTSQAVGLIVDTAGPSHTAPLFPAAGDPTRQGFMRIVNRGGRSVVHIEANDADGTGASGTGASSTLSLRRAQTAHFNSDDLENGNFAKGLSRGAGTGMSDWWLRLWSNDVRALAYIRTADGFLTSMHELVARDADGAHRVPIFNPGRNTNQVSLLKLVNEGGTTANVTIAGLDDDGEPGGLVRLSLPGGASRSLTAQELESGAGLDGRLVPGRGKWRLEVRSDQPILVASLLRSPTGHLTNLSTRPANSVVANGRTTHHIPYFPGAADQDGRQGFARVVNSGRDEATVRIVAFDDSGEGLATSLTVRGHAAAHFNSDDLELGSTEKGLSGIGMGFGDWRLELESDTAIEVLAYIRHADGFLTSMHDVAPGTSDYRYEVPTFNPASNRKQLSRLLLANAAETDATVTITGVDDRGVTHGDVGLTVPARRTVTLSAQDLESGSAMVTGSLGDGAGKWRLVVEADGPLWVMGLLESPTRHLTNLTTVPE